MQGTYHAGASLSIDYWVLIDFAGNEPLVQIHEIFNWKPREYANKLLKMVPCLAQNGACFIVVS